MTVGRPVVRCNPAQKTHDQQVFPIVDDTAYLAIYEVDPPSDGVEVLMEDQFTLEQLSPTDGMFLAVSSQKPTSVGVADPLQTATWVRVKSAYR